MQVRLSLELANVYRVIGEISMVLQKGKAYCYFREGFLRLLQSIMHAKLDDDDDDNPNAAA